MNAQRVGRIAIKDVNSIINYIVLTIILLLSAFATYALWDSKQIYQAADKSNYTIYKPTVENEGKSFKELQAINEDVFAWLNVYGTNIDYPVTQGPDNSKYINTNAEGNYSLSGAIFLDHENKKDFSDFNNILYGHHMEKNAMFGDVGTFADKDVFDTHKYGSLYYDGKDHGIKFFAFVHTDAYDSSTFTVDIRTEEARQAYLDHLFEKSVYTRDIGVTTNDHIILLSTCSSSSTNGRDILVGIITDRTYEDTTNANANDDTEQPAPELQYCYVSDLPVITLLLMLTLAALLIVRIAVICNSVKYRKTCQL